MIREGGLSLGELLERARLRVNEVTKGAQVPWNSAAVDTSFVFFERTPDAPLVQTSAVRSRPIRDLGGRDAYLAALQRDSLQGYEEFLDAYPDDPMARRVRALIAARREAITWRSTYAADTANAYWSYLRRYPHGPHAPDCRRRLADLAAASVRHGRLRRAAAAARGGGLCRAAGACLRRLRLPAATAAAGLLPSAAAARVRGVGAASRGR